MIKKKYRGSFEKNAGTTGSITRNYRGTLAKCPQLSTPTRSTLTWHHLAARWRTPIGWLMVNCLCGLLTGLVDSVFTVLVDRIKGVRLVLIVAVDDGSNS